MFPLFPHRPGANVSRLSISLVIISLLLIQGARAQGSIQHETTYENPQQFEFNWKTAPSPINQLGVVEAAITEDLQVDDDGDFVSSVLGSRAVHLCRTAMSPQTGKRRLEIDGRHALITLVGPQGVANPPPTLKLAFERTSNAPAQLSKSFIQIAQSPANNLRSFSIQKGV